MFEELLVWTLAVYACASLLAALLKYYGMRMNAGTGDVMVHYHLLLGNSENSIEWEVRRLLMASRLRGEPIHISFADHGSTDDTLRMKTILERKYFYLAGDIQGSGNTVTIDLRRPELLES